MKGTWLLPDKSDSVFWCVFQWKWHNFYLTRVIPLSATSCPTLSRIPSTRSQVLQFLLSEGRQSQVWVKIYSAWKYDQRWSEVCLKMSNKDVSENVSERVKGSDGRWRNRETAAENVRMCKNPLFHFYKPLEWRSCFVCFSIASNSGPCHWPDISHLSEDRLWVKALSFVQTLLSRPEKW